MKEAVKKEAEKIWIPKVPASEIRTRAAHIRPVVSFPIIGKCYIRPPDIFDEVYLRRPRPRWPAWGLKKSITLKTYHAKSDDEIFSPTIAEVLAQIPFEHLKATVAFEILDMYDSAAGSHHDPQACVAGYMVAHSRLYTLR